MSIHRGATRMTRVMGIVNVTPDSFSDGGRFWDPVKAIERGLSLEQEGANILDVGGESTRPGADPVDEEEECRRVLPVIEGLVKRGRLPVSVDTMKSGVAERAIRAGASWVNDVSALRYDPRMADIVARNGVPVVLMHMKGTPRDMQKSPVYYDVVHEVYSFFEERIRFAMDRGIRKENMILDPGIGFGKTLDHNLTLLNRLEAFVSLGCPLLVGPSRKSFIGEILKT
ncbi:MAG: dihydropteroate synthase, partial [Nitrospirae bacterium]|nr:dihydropteroate synthase [Nitrospirota bacterium]